MRHDNEEWCKVWGGIDFSVQNWYEEFDKFWPEHSKISKIYNLMGCFWLKYIMFDVKNVQRSYTWWPWRICQNFVHRLKNSDFILENKMAKLNQNKNSKQPDRPDAV